MCTSVHKRGKRSYLPKAYILFSNKMSPPSYPAEHINHPPSLSVYPKRGRTLKQQRPFDVVRRLEKYISDTTVRKYIISSVTFSKECKRAIQPLLHLYYSFSETCTRRKGAIHSNNLRADTFSRGADGPDVWKNRLCVGWVTRSTTRYSTILPYNSSIIHMTASLNVFQKTITSHLSSPEWEVLSSTVNMYTNI